MSTKPSTQSPAVGAERRAFPRFVADQVVVLQTDGEAKALCAGRVLDVSERGLRVQHEKEFQSGVTVHVLTADMDLPAIVVWTRPEGQHWESGLRTDDRRAILLRKT
jgi:hypothetical protein